MLLLDSFTVLEFGDRVVLSVGV